MRGCIVCGGDVDAWGGACRVSAEKAIAEVERLRSVLKTMTGIGAACEARRLANEALRHTSASPYANRAQSTTHLMMRVVECDPASEPDEWAEIQRLASGLVG